MSVRAGRQDGMHVYSVRDLDIVGSYMGLSSDALTENDVGATTTCINATWD